MPPAHPENDGGFPGSASSKKIIIVSTCQCRRHGFNPWIGKIPWRARQSTAVGESPWTERSLAGYSPWGPRESDTTKASGGDGIPVELFQILKDDAVKVLHSVSQQIWKTQQWPQDWKRSVFIPIPKKGNAKECSNYRTIAFISHSSKGMLKILQARLQQYVNRELPDVQAGFRKGRGTRDQIANIRWIIKKAREFQKKHLLLLY